MGLYLSKAMVKALTIWEKKLICEKREEIKYAKEKLCGFSRYFMDDQGLPVPTFIF